MRYLDGRSQVMAAALLASSLLAAAPLRAQADDPLGGYVR